MIKIIFFILLGISLSGSLNAMGINEDLNNYFNGLGLMTNAAVPQVYQGQQAGYYTGGSLNLPNNTQPLQLLDVELPNFRAGCGGIDLFTGGFSFINAEELIKAFQNVMNNAGGYAFTLALETATPELANVMKYIYDMANKVNSMNINSCETAEALVGGLWPRTRASQQQVCRDLGGNSSNGLFTDWAQGRQQCGIGGEFSATMDKARQNTSYKNMTFTSGNLIWKVLRQTPMLAGNDELAEFFMSLSGSVILEKEQENSPVHFKILPALLEKNSDLLTALLKGGKATFYQCDTKDADGCLHPAPKEIMIPAEQAFSGRIKQILQGMVEKIFSGIVLTAEEQGLLQASALPIYKMLNVQAALMKNKNNLDVTLYAETLANDVLHQYLTQILQSMKWSLTVAQYPEDLLNTFRPVLEKELALLRDEQKNTYAQLSSIFAMIQQSQLLESTLTADLSLQLSGVLSWARGQNN